MHQSHIIHVKSSVITGEDALQGVNTKVMITFTP